jgi:hypothetical protein
LSPIASLVAERRWCSSPAVISLKSIQPRTSERAKLAKGCNFPSFAMTVTRRRPDKDFPHGMPTTQADTINADLLAFLKA